METKEKILLWVCTIMIGLMISTFFLWHNSNWFPAKERNNVTIEIYYQSGKVDKKTFNLPEKTEISVLMEGRGGKYHHYKATSLWYHCHTGPFSNEFGYLAFNVDDYKIISVDPCVK